ncbi:BUD13-like protein [Iris pallida]|uniref:BUD13-like protein n=1 Tax=Iris pallida TaxID=29817 RepID=A0AAX6HJB5_IRIPA|nr:BUD13-like protein [Iris pallida]
MAASSVSLKEYLKKYQSEADDMTKKKKKKKKPNINPIGSGVLVFDEDPVWQKPVQIEDPNDEDSADEVPQVDEDIEVKRMRRLEAIRSRKPYHSISDDGSGWVSVSDQPMGANSDLCPRRARFDSPSPEREVKAEPDLSPMRQRRLRADTPSPVREVNADRDLSPPRQRGQQADTLSPVQEVKVEPDLSPPRQRRRQADMPDDDDLLPPRRNGGRSEEADLSPPRRSRTRLVEGGGDGDLSPPRRSRGRGDGDDISPPRSRVQLPDGDLLPPRRKEPLVAKETDLSPPRRKKEVRRTGLISAEEIRKENEKKRKADIKRFASMNASVSGKGAEPVFRDKEGKRISKEEILKKDEEEKPKEKNLEWGKGLAQKREAEARARELELEKEKPFARTRDDPELEKMLKERVRWGDPMAHLVKQKTSEPVLEDLGDDEKMKDSGFLIPQTVPSHSWIKRGIDCPPNRYGIRPGRHWDGVDRSNGYEKELFKRQNEKRATESEAYLWSVADM